jgi:hypothetical protein
MRKFDDLKTISFCIRKILNVSQKYSFATDQTFELVVFSFMKSFSIFKSISVDEYYEFSNLSKVQSLHANQWPFFVKPKKEKSNSFSRLAIIYL